MSLILENAQKIVAGQQAQDVNVECRDFWMVNTSESGVVYLKEKEDDGQSATAENSFALLPGTMTPQPLNAKVLSVAASEDGVDVRILYLRGVI